MRTFVTALIVLAGLAHSAFAQQPATDPTQAYIDAGFTGMDADGNGQVDRAEFDRFMRARLAEQQASFNAAFAELDKNGDGKISKAEAGVLAPLAENFAAIDTDRNGAIGVDELRSAMLAAQAEKGPAG